MSGKRTSLQKLQALDKDFHDLPSQLRELCLILKAPELLIQDATKIRTKSRTANGRLDWALRWLLTKLKASGTTGLEARASPQAWILLANLINSLHPTPASRALNSAGVLSLILNTLRENFNRFYQSTPAHVLRVSGGDKEDEDVSMIDADSSEGKKSKKRKREAASQDDDARGTKRRVRQEQSTPDDKEDNPKNRLALYQALRILLDLLAAPTEQNTLQEDKVDRESFRAVLRTDLVTAAEFLGSWLDASVKDISLSAALEIWKHRVTAPGEDVLMTFSKYCLAPAVSTIQHLKGRQDLTKEHLEEHITVLERLIAEHVMLPTKRRVRQQRTGAADGGADSETVLAKVFAPLRNNGNAVDAVPDIFKLAIRCTPMSTPRRRITESPWLESLFTVLANSIGCDLQTRAEKMPPEFDTLMELIQLISKHKVILKRSTTKAILRHYVLGDEARISQWSLLAQLVQIDSGLFVDDIDALKSVFVATRALITSEYAEIIDTIFNPILKALVAARSIRTFISGWHDELRSQLESKREYNERHEQHSFSSYDAPVWEDAGLVQALSHHLEGAMTVRQLNELIAQLTKQLTTDREPHYITANASMLSSVLTALRNVENVRLLLPQIRELLDLVLNMLQSLAGDVHEARSRLWILIATLHRLYTSAAAPVDTTKLVMTYDARLDEILNADLIRGQQRNVDTFPLDIASSLLCLGSICDNLRSRYVALTCLNSVKSIPALLRSIQPGLPVSVLVDLAESLGCFSILQLQGNYTETRAARVTSMFSIWLRVMKAETHLEEGLSRRGLLLTNEDIVKWNAVLDEADNINTANASPAQDSEHDGTLSRLSRASLEHCTEEKRDMYIAMISSMMHSSVDSSERWSAALSALLRFVQDNRISPASDNAFKLDKIAVRLDEYMEKSSGSAGENLSFSLLFYNICRAVFDARLKEHGDPGSDKQKETDAVTTFHGHSMSHLASMALLKAMASAETADGTVFSYDQQLIIITLHRQLMEKLGHSGTKVPANPDPIDLVAALDVLGSIGGQDVFSQYKGMMETLVDDQKLSTVDDISVKVMLYRLKCRLNRLGNTVPDLEKTLALLAVVKSKQNATTVEGAVLETLNAATSVAKAEFVRALTPSSEKAFFGQERLQLLHVLLKASSSKQYRSVLPEELITPLTSSLQLYLPKVSTSHAFFHTAQSLQHLLKSHSRHLPQSVIENTLLTISDICSASSSPRIPPTPQASRHIFTLTTNLLQTLLTHHRRKLRGRFELVVVALQALLRCLFTSSSTSTFGQIPQPTWMPRKSTSIEAKGLDASHVSQFTRLLMSICDPTLSAVRSGSSKSGAGALTDETRKAKRYAGQHVQYVLMELCECQLKGRLVGGADGAREALTPGVWAMLEVIGKDGLSACMEGMAGGGRSVLRGWWEEWRTVGRGRW